VIRTPFENQSEEAESKIIATVVAIKILIKDYVLKQKNMAELGYLINKKINALKLPVPVEEYQIALKQSSGEWIRNFSQNTATKTLDAPMKVYTGDYKYFGYPNADDYTKQVHDAIKELASNQGFNLLPKVEIDLRHKKQMEDIDDFVKNGELIKRISQHASCSKRCEKWQGKLIHLTAPAKHGYDTGIRYNGEIVYSFQAIINKVDKYGYKNNVIVGFNCRHHLNHADTPQQDEYTKEEIEENRRINDKMRQMERYIRNCKLKDKLSIDKQTKSKWLGLAREMTKKYIKFAEDNKIAWYPWRLRI
jgi:hypothetical protein